MTSSPREIRDEGNASSLKGLRSRYIFVLAAIGVLSLGSYLLLGESLLQQDTSAAEINLAGRQRMLTQRIGLLQSRLGEATSEQGKAENLKQLEEAINLMATSHKGLTIGDRTIGVTAASSKMLKELYFGPVSFVDKEVGDYLAKARRYVQAVKNKPLQGEQELDLSAGSSVVLLSHLDRIVSQYQLENEEKVAQVQILRHLTVIVTLGLLVFSGLFVFRPMVRRIHRNVAELASAEERFRSIAFSSSMAMIIGEGEGGRIAGWNPAAENMFGYSSEEIMGREIISLIPERFHLAHNLGYDRAIKAGVLKGGYLGQQLMAMRKDGSEFPIELSLGFWEEDGEPFFGSIINDISERLKTERTTDRLGRIVENATNEFFLFDANTLELVFVNSGGLKNLGYTPEKILQLTPLDLVVDLNPADFQKTVELLRSGQKDVALLSEEMMRADGSSYSADVVLQFMQNESPPLFLAVVNDVSDRVALELSLRRSQKLEAVGQLAGGIAHDFNNLLGIILGNLEMLSRKLEMDDRNTRRIEAALKATRRAAELTKQILGFSRLSPTSFDALDLNVVIRGMQNLIEQSAGPGVKVQFDITVPDSFHNTNSINGFRGMFGLNKAII
jgi:PAS domain S-box-containing protein